MKKLKLLAMVALGFAGLQTASAGIVLDPFQVYGGTGLGAVSTILTFQNNPTETGCVSFGGSIGSVLTSSGICTGSAADVKTGASQTQTRTLAQGGITSASNFALILNAVEPAGGGITLKDVIVAFYSPTGALLFQTSGLFCAASGGVTTSGSCLIPVTATGTGNSGYKLTLDAAQQAAATAAGVFLNTSNVMGMSSTITGTSGGNETFFIANIQQVSPVPEPATGALLGGGLLALAWVLRRRKAS